jgi:hypothetical protein
MLRRKPLQASSEWNRMSPAGLLDQRLRRLALVIFNDWRAVRVRQWSPCQLGFHGGVAGGPVILVIDWRRREGLILITGNGHDDLHSG